MTTALDTSAGRRAVHRLRSTTVADVVVGLAVLVVLYLVVRAGRDTTVSFHGPTSASTDRAVRLLPGDAVLTLLRMFAALAASYAFALGYGWLAASSRRAERVLIPVLDILQSVPVLGFLSVATTGLLALFPGTTIGLELVAIFAIFTSQAWNLAFSFHGSLTSEPADLDEAARLLGLSRWRRFWTLDVPWATTGLVWNGMMSMGGGWFFLVASEAITVGGVDRSLPGVGSYTAAAIAAGDLTAVGWAVLTMTIMVVGVNVVFWRPLVAWSERFRHGPADATPPRSAVLDLLRRSHWPRAVGRLRRRLAEPVGRFGDRLLGTDRSLPVAADADDGIRWTSVVGAALVGLGTWRFLDYVTAADGYAVFGRPIVLGFVTLLRVAAVLVGSTILWFPVGIWIGLDPRRIRIAQPVVQVLASFPANVLFPFAIWFLVRTGLSLQIGGVALMALGAQWYVLFNVIAGAQAIPGDLRDAMDDLGVTGLRRWRCLYVPAVFPAFVVGAIAAAGGAWNASIVAEVVTYGSTRLTASGLGAYLAEATDAGNFPHVLVGIAVMAVFVVGLNRLVWYPLARFADRRWAAT
jgi:NitT/TauT family transport system permease protein